MIDNTFHKIPVTFFDESYNKYQNEVMNLLHFIRAFLLCKLGKRS